MSLYNLIERINAVKTALYELILSKTAEITESTPFKYYPQLLNKLISESSGGETPVIKTNATLTHSDGVTVKEWKGWWEWGTGSLKEENGWYSGFGNNTNFLYWADYGIPQGSTRYYLKQGDTFHLTFKVNQAAKNQSRIPFIGNNISINGDYFRCSSYNGIDNFLVEVKYDTVYTFTVKRISETDISISINGGEYSNTFNIGSDGFPRSDLYSLAVTGLEYIQIYLPETYISKGEA